MLKLFASEYFICCNYTLQWTTFIDIFLILSLPYFSNPYSNRNNRDKRKEPRGPRDNGGSSKGGSHGLFAKAIDSVTGGRKNGPRDDKGSRNQNRRDKYPESHERWYKVMVSACYPK